MNSNSLYVGLLYHEICGLNSKVYINLLKLCTESCGLFFRTRYTLDGLNILWMPPIILWDGMAWVFWIWLGRKTARYRSTCVHMQPLSKQYLSSIWIILYLVTDVEWLLEIIFPKFEILPDAEGGWQYFQLRQIIPNSQYGVAEIDEFAISSYV